jgi:PAS domain S-box-containing protein
MALPASPAELNAMRWTRITKTLAQLAICVAAVTAVAAVFYTLPLRDRPLSPALAFLFVILIVSAVWGFRYAVFVSFLAALGFLWLLTPVGQYWIDDPRDWLALAAFLVIGIVTSHLSERARRESLARRSEKELRDVIETMPAMAWTALPDGSNTFVSKRWTEYTGLSAEDIDGRGWQTAARPEDLDRYFEKWRASRTSGQPFESEVRFRRAADGEYRWFLARAVPLRDERGNVLKWYGMMTDIEDRKRAEAEARDSERQLREVQLELAHANRVATIGQLTASIVHEVIQPIAAMVTNAEAALRFLDAQTVNLDKVRQIQNDIMEAGNRAANVISRIHDLFKKAPPRRDRWEINGAIREVIEITHGEAVKNGISVRTELADGLPLVQGDRVQLQQVSLNLIINAIQAMSGLIEGTRELHVGTENAGQDGVRVAVRDSGPGLSPESLQRLFEPFYTTKPNGMGMGLSICRSIIEDHGGRLWATGLHPHGAVFQFTIPTR